MTEQLGIPYMGSKRKLASKIVDFIIDLNKGVEYVYDVFGGGGPLAMSLCVDNKLRGFITMI